LDLYCAFRNHTNGKQLHSGSGLIGALVYFGLSAITAEEKDSNRELVLRGGPWSVSEQD